MMILIFSLSTVAAAADCTLPDAQPDGYDGVAQQDFLANYFALSLSDSPIHAPIPDEPGHGHVGLQVLAIPPLPCSRRLVEYETPHTQVPPSGKFENTNKTPAAPRLAFGFTFPSVGGWDLYGSAVYLPPVPVFGTTNVILGGEVGVGRKLGERWSGGLRAAAQTTKTVGATARALSAPMSLRAIRSRFREAFADGASTSKGLALRAERNTASSNSMCPRYSSTGPMRRCATRTRDSPRSRSARERD